MKCTECRYFQRNILDSAPWCEAWRKSKRIQPGDEERDLPCSKGELSESLKMYDIGKIIVEGLQKGLSE